MGLDAAETNCRLLRSIYDFRKYVLPITIAYCARGKAYQLFNFKKLLVFCIREAQGEAFFQVYLLVLFCMAFGSDIGENDGDDTYPLGVVMSFPCIVAVPEPFPLQFPLCLVYMG